MSKPTQEDWFKLGLEHVEKGENEKAAECFSNAPDVYIDDKGAWIMKVSAMIILKRWDLALQYSDKALKLFPEEEEIEHSKGIALMYLKRFKEAILIFEMELAKNPDDQGVLENKGISLLQLGKYTEAIKTFEHLLEINPKNPSTCNFLAMSYEKLGDMQKAGYYVRKGLELDEDTDDE